MSRELFWLTLTAIMTGLMWVPYILDRVTVRGLMGAMDNPTPNAKPHSPWARRQMHAHDNAVENLLIFAILVLTPQASALFLPLEYQFASGQYPGLEPGFRRAPHPNGLNLHFLVRR